MMPLGSWASALWDIARRKVGGRHSWPPDDWRPFFFADTADHALHDTHGKWSLSPRLRRPPPRSLNVRCTSTPAISESARLRKKRPLANGLANEAKRSPTPVLELGSGWPPFTGSPSGSHRLKLLVVLFCMTCEARRVRNPETRSDFGVRRPERQSLPDCKPRGQRAT
jgi:hypothetical protein